MLFNLVLVLYLCPIVLSASDTSITPSDLAPEDEVEVPPSLAEP